MEGEARLVTDTQAYVLSGRERGLDAPAPDARELFSWRVAAGILLIGTVAFACLRTMPLYSENQNTKFLYGLAKAGVGRLKDDWLIGQGSELPIFDALVYLTQSYAGGWCKC